VLCFVYISRKVNTLPLIFAYHLFLCCTFAKIKGCTK